MQNVQKEFNKLPINKKHKFIVKNLLQDNYFSVFHDKCKILYIKEIYNTKNEQLSNNIIKNNYFMNKITYLLTNYKDNIIDLYCHPTNNYFYNQALFYKNKLLKIIKSDLFIIIDEHNFTISDLIIDVWATTKNIIIKPDTDIYDLIQELHKYYK